MPRCRITVLKRTLNSDVAERYCRNKVAPCESFRDGQQFTATLAKPQDFCDWAWNDIHQYVTALLAGGDFAGSIFNGWMKDRKKMIACCTDGVRPVVFELEKIED